MSTQQIPKIKIIDGEVWVCIGHESLASKPFGVVTFDQLKARDAAVITNEHKRMAYILDNIDNFAEWIQWRGNPPEGAKFLEVFNPWIHDPREPNVKAKK